MYTYSILLVLSFIAAAALTPVVRRMALCAGAVDRPGERKIHSNPTATLGGIAIAVAFFAPQAGILLLDNRIKEIYVASSQQVLALCAVSAVIFLLGAWDDVRCMSAPVKLGVQICAAAALYAAGFRIERFSNPFGAPVELGLLGGPATVLWLVAITNALNFIDGIDGAAAGVAAIAAFAIANGTEANTEIVTWVMASCVIGSALGFLVHNFHPASIFMGNSGAMFLGFILAAISVESMQKSTAAMAMVVPIAALALPIADVVLAIVRRLAGKRQIMSGDRGHIHHRLLANGMGQQAAALAMYGLSGVSALVAVTLAHSRREMGLFVAVFLVLFLMAVLRGVMVVKAKEGGGNGEEQEK